MSASSMASAILKLSETPQMKSGVKVADNFRQMFEGVFEFAVIRCIRNSVTRQIRRNDMAISSEQRNQVAKHVT